MLALVRPEATSAQRWFDRKVLEDWPSPPSPGKQGGRLGAGVPHWRARTGGSLVWPVPGEAFDKPLTRVGQAQGLLARSGQGSPSPHPSDQSQGTLLAASHSARPGFPGTTQPRPTGARKPTRSCPCARGHRFTPGSLTPDHQEEGPAAPLC